MQIQHARRAPFTIQPLFCARVFELDKMDCSLSTGKEEFEICTHILTTTCAPSHLIYNTQGDLAFLTGAAERPTRLLLATRECGDSSPRLSSKRYGNSLKRCELVQGLAQHCSFSSRPGLCGRNKRVDRGRLKWVG